MAYADITIERAVEVIAVLADTVREVVMTIPAESLRVRPSPQEWSVTEYICHLRDVYVTSTIRLHRVRTEDRPALEPMLNDLRAQRFRYNECDLTAVIDELGSAIAGFRDEVALTSDEEWDRTGTRLPGEARTARWIARQAMHEGVHHVADIRRIGRAVVPNHEVD